MPYHYHRFQAAFTFVAILVLPVYGTAQGVMHSAPRPNLSNLSTRPATTHTIEHITVNTPHHGQGTFTIYRPASDTARYSRGRPVNNRKKDNRTHKPVRRTVSPSRQNDLHRDYYPDTGSRGGLYLRYSTPGIYRGQGIQVYSGSYSTYRYQQRPITGFQYYPTWRQGQYPHRHQHSGEPRQIDHFRIPQCLGAGCNRR